MQCCDVGYPIAPAQWKMHVIDMKMNDVEIGCARENMFQHNKMVCHLIHATLIQARIAGTPEPGALLLSNLRWQTVSLRVPVAPVPR